MSGLQTQRLDGRSRGKRIRLPIGEGHGGQAFQALRSVEKLVNEFFVGDHAALGSQLAESLLLRLGEEVANGVKDLFELLALDGSVTMTIEFLEVGEQLGLGIAFADSCDDGGLEFLHMKEGCAFDA